MILQAAPPGAPPQRYDSAQKHDSRAGAARTRSTDQLGSVFMNSIVVPVAAWATWGREQWGSQPEVSFIEPLLRRRLSFLDRIALHLANACAPHEGRAQLVFASRHGELARSADLLAQLAADELPSPMGFSLSVLNAAPGLYGIARKDLSPSTAMSAEEATFPLALIEAAAQALDGPEAPVVLAFADEPPPEAYRELVDVPREAHGIGLRLDARAPRVRILMSWSPGEGEDAQEDAVTRFAGCLSRGAAGGAERGSAAWTGRGHAFRWEVHALA